MGLDYQVTEGYASIADLSQEAYEAVQNKVLKYERALRIIAQWECAFYDDKTNAGIAREALTAFGITKTGS